MNVGERYFLSFSGGLDVLQAQEQAPETLLALATLDLRKEIADPVNYETRSRYDDRIFRKVIALVYAIEAAGGRLDRREDGGEAGGAFVPREPIRPRLCAEAENALPEALHEIDNAAEPLIRR